MRIFIYPIICILFLLFSFLSIQPLSQCLGFFVFFLLPGLLLIQNLRPRAGIVEKLTYGFAISTSISVVTFLTLGLFLKLSEVIFIIPLALLVISAPSTLELRPLRGIKKMRREKLFYILMFSLLIRTILLLQIHTIIGHDVGRFSIISHTLVLKDKITLDLRPYDDAKGFFYFPAAFIIPTILELIGFDPIFGVTIFLITTSIFGILAFYLLILRIFGKQLALRAAFFYAFLFDPILHLGIFGIFPNAMSIFFVILSMITLYEILNGKETNIWISSLIFFGIYAFHLYPILMLFIFTLALISEKILLEGLRTIKIALSKFPTILLIVLVLSAPHLLLSRDYLPISFRKENIADLMMFAYERINWQISEKLLYSLAGTPLGGLISPLSIASFIFLLLTAPTLYKKAPFLLLFCLYAFIFSFLVISEFNLVRSVIALWFIYPVVLSLLLRKWKANFLILLLFFWIESQSPLFLMWYFWSSKPEDVPWIINPSFFETIQFIKGNIPQNSKFLIDGGGAGCTGATPSYGERIFPLTSREIFFFTNYCWADYDRKIYEHKVEIYRRISIDPDDEEAILELKKYGVTHIYIGREHLALNPELFLKSQKHYEVIYQKDGEYIFQIK
ncbi:MAG: glycosyltransferase family 39 protein [Candidatus Nanoarchaeia archaeon]|nr:glycosyltransferase family 39 protein [Candidatus Haiyanarchaeum thermophilum]MCW1303350.1 glycosyltransferase family 39 protein [Candidatus Haiyanarchaeum thermophilum]MCW1304068.1 glycosyltransferase family 39 protein [Candidatus Haiyanarchaeum thermophilum]MCW1306510.1 glycosyltransferase family 39 protein [Candidatus Haiyanarchaeum thermophilum]MCW1307538.1 glycosyltransferase family 39 protein [Candidatus Haiyanarchaeum thermophilum]